ncbi:hypothetical protein [Dankookia sp. P2]|uniref:hypothetical protein n=1 Tax=Dankookia sp. P2 TaxID=3423955 RepID=UPI003D66F627
MSSYFSESFNNGVGALSHTWGNGIDTSVRGQVTISGNSGIMENPWGLRRRPWLRHLQHHRVDERPRRRPRRAAMAGQ